MDRMGRLFAKHAPKAKLCPRPAASLTLLIFLVPISLLAAHFPPSITSQPTNQTVVIGQSAAFAVSASGTAPLVYQWRFNGTNLPGSTNTDLVLTSVSLSKAGLYSVQVTNLYGAPVSSNATLTVGLPPAISAQPISQAALLGSNATFMVTAAGTPPFSYQWQFNASDSAGATNSTLDIIGVQSNKLGGYRAIVTSPYGAVTSSPATLALATPPGFLWVRNVTNGVSPNYAAISSATHIAADNAGNVFAAGTFYGISPASINFGGGTLTNSAGSSVSAYFICKYDRFGNFAWARQVATNDSYSGGLPLRLVTDSAGNVYFAGRFNGSATFGTNTLVSSSTANLFLAKYDSQGQALWARQIGAYDSSSGALGPVLALAVDSNANAFVSSRYTSTANFGSTVISNSDAFLAKYDSLGNLVWAKPSAAMDAIAVGISGSIYVTGSALSTGPGVLAKYDLLGGLVWSRQFPQGKSIAVDSSENVYTTGWGSGTYGDITITNTAYSHFFIAKCNSSGQLKWVREAGSLSQWVGLGVALDAFGNIYATAVSANVQREPVFAFGSSTLSNAYSFLAKYDPAGNALWAVAPGGTNYAPPYAMSLVNHQEIYLAGKFYYNATFGKFSLFDSNPMGPGDFYVAKFAADTTAVVTLGSPQAFAGGSQIQFDVAGVPGFKYAIEASTNLIYWISLQTNTSPFLFVDPAPSSFAHRYYRSMLIP